MRALRHHGGCRAAPVGDVWGAARVATASACAGSPDLVARPGPSGSVAGAAATGEAGAEPVESVAAAVDGAAELEQSLQLAEQQPAGQVRVVGVHDERPGQGRLRGALDVEDRIAQGALELVERRAGGRLDLLDDGVEVRDLVLELVDGPLDRVPEVADAEGKPRLGGDVADQRASGVSTPLLPPVASIWMLSAFAVSAPATGLSSESPATCSAAVAAVGRTAHRAHR